MWLRGWALRTDKHALELLAGSERCGRGCCQKSRLLAKHNVNFAQLPGDEQTKGEQPDNCPAIHVLVNAVLHAGMIVKGIVAIEIHLDAVTFEEFLHCWSGAEEAVPKSLVEPVLGTEDGLCCGTHWG